MTNAVAIAQSGSNNVTFRNRIINGAMGIDQRNGGAAISLTNSVGYPVDRFIAVTATSTTVSFQQSSIAPANFTKSLSATVTTPKTLAAADLNRFIHRIEGFNIADLNWGTASAQPVTLSFWARASVTGTYTVQIGSGQSYLAAYTINTANTWEQKTITVPGSTSGTWPTDNSAGLEINFVLGAGSNWVGVAGAWGGSAIFTVSGAANWIGTNGATFYITGVQLEKGTAATSFDYRPYGTELALCQRYFFKSISESFAVQSAAYTSYCYKVTMRASPTLTLTPTSGTATVGTQDANGFSAIGSTGPVGVHISATAEL